MSLRARFYLALASSFVVIGVHVAADRLYLYWTVPSIDIPMHMLGGIMAGLYAAVCLMYFKKSQTCRAIVLGALIVGIGWEILELTAGAADTTEAGYLLDTVVDLIDDVIGGVVAYLIWRKL